MRALIGTLIRRACSVIRSQNQPIRPSDEDLLKALPSAQCDGTALGRFSPDWLTETFSDAEIHLDWADDARRLERLRMPEMKGGVNPGDQRALYYLARRIQPATFLEIGTHIGSSTLALALAAARNSVGGQKGPRITTVDIRDVNDDASRPWEAARSPASPASLANTLGISDHVCFKVNRAVDELSAQDSPRYDIIFLDGDHSATAVYREIPLALRKLNPGGMIILHDFFPKGLPLWEGQSPLLGPWMALDRFAHENAPFKAIPLGTLPWPTKLGSQVTSLAVLSQPLDP